METSPDDVTVHSMIDLDGFSTGMPATKTRNANCALSPQLCFTLSTWSEIGLTEREIEQRVHVRAESRAGRAFHRVTATRGARTATAVRRKRSRSRRTSGEASVLAVRRRQERFRFVATVTTDPDASADDLELPDPDNCADRSRRSWRLHATFRRDRGSWSSSSTLPVMRTATSRSGSGTSVTARRAPSSSRPTRSTTTATTTSASRSPTATARATPTRCVSRSPTWHQRSERTNYKCRAARPPISAFAPVRCRRA